MNASRSGQLSGSRQFSAPQIVKKWTSEPEANGRACCGTQRSTRQMPNRLQASFSARAESTSVLSDLRVVMGGAVETDPPERALISKLQFPYQLLHTPVSRVGGLGNPSR